MVIKPFKTFITEMEEGAKNKINKILLDYTNGSDDIENEQPDVKMLFKQLYDIFEGEGIPIWLKEDGKPFDGSGIVVQTKKEMHFDIGFDGQDPLPYRLHVEIKQADNGNYFFGFLKLESK